MELDYKIIASILGILITFIGYFYYIKDIFKGQNKPHLYSWLIWSVGLFIGFGIQFSNDGGYGSFITFFEGLFYLLIVFISLKKGERNITKSDKISLLFGFISIFFWLILNQPLISIILIILIDFFGFLPTFRKSYNKPFEESISVYLAGSILFSLSLIGLSEYKFLTYGYPLAIIILDSTLMLMILYKRTTKR